MNVTNLKDKFEGISDYWSPGIIAEMNGQYIKLAKIKGEFVWHSHEHEDEYFQVIKGAMIIHLRDKLIRLKEGDCYVVPKGVEHKPVAEEEAHIMLIEPKNTAQPVRTKLS